MSGHLDERLTRQTDRRRLLSERNAKAREPRGQGGQFPAKL